MYIKEAGGGEESVPELGVVIRGDSHLHIDRIWSTYNRVPGPPLQFSSTHTCTQPHLEGKQQEMSLLPVELSPFRVGP